MDRKPHDRKIRTFNLVDAYLSDPFLDAICSSLVERTECVDVVFDFIFGEILEMNQCRIAQCAVHLAVSECDCGDDLVAFAGQMHEHVIGFLARMRLTHHSSFA